MEERLTTFDVHVAVGPGADAEEVAEATFQLRRELLELDVEAVDIPRAGEPPPGSRAVDVAALGALVVTFAQPQLLASVVSAVQSWLAGSHKRSIKLAWMLKDFYVAFSAICFTLLGLWLIVVQTRHADWRGDAGRRRRAHGVAMNFSLPGLMSLLSLINPDSVLLWRVSFAIAALGGTVILAVLRGAAPTRFGLPAYVLAIGIYALIALLAIAPGIVAGIGLDVAAVRVEAVLLTLLVFLDVNIAWLLLFEESIPRAAVD